MLPAAEKNDTTLSESFLTVKSQRGVEVCIPMIVFDFDFVFLAKRTIIG